MSDAVVEDGAAATLDRGSFRESFEVAALRVPARQTGDFLKQLGKCLLNLPRRKNVERAPDGDGENLVLLSRGLEGDIAKLPATQREWLQSRMTPGSESGVSLTTAQVTLEYDYFSAEEILQKLLPKGVEVPTSFEQAGHICHLNLRDSQLPFRFLIGQVLLDKNKSIKTVVNKVGKIETEFRTFEMEHIAGDPSTVVQLKEHGCQFHFDLRKVYWNSRLQMEHGRLIEVLIFKPVVKLEGAAMPVVADATAGVGPFSIPLVKHGGRLVSHANDLNPDSIAWLRKNAACNNLAHVIELPGDLPPFSEEHAAIDGSPLLVIHQPGDAGNFIRALFAQRHPVTHAIFNLPATGVEMLGCFQDLDYGAAGLPRPLVSCYSFSDEAPDVAAPGGAVGDLLQRLAKALLVPLDSLRYSRGPAADAGKEGLPLASPQVAQMVQAAHAPVVIATEEEQSKSTIGSGASISVAVRLIRNVAPTRNMFCVCFQVPPMGSEGASESDGAPLEKRARTS